jgi:hypothetical protein
MTNDLGNGKVRRREARTAKPDKEFPARGRIFRSFFVVALALLACDEHYSAQSMPPAASERAGASPVIAHPHTQDPGELEAALLATDPAQAVSLFWRFTCASSNNIEAAEVVRRAWDRRDSSGATGALKDPLVRTLMAKCLAEDWPRFKPIDPSYAPVLAQLRRAINSDDPEQVRAAAFGLTQTATADDVQSIVAAAARLPAVAVLLSSDLWQICRLDAIEGARKISAGVMDARQRASLEANEEHFVATQKLLCEFDANIVGKDVSQADIDDFWVPGHGGPRPSADDIRNALQSTNVHDAREMLLRLRCLPSENDGLELIRAAWRTRNSGPTESVARNLDFRVAMAVCLADDGAASNTAVDASIMEALRQAVRSSDPHTFIAGLDGLSRVATAADVRIIENALKGRSSIFAAVAVGNLTRSCAPGAERAAETLRERTSSPQSLRAIEYEIWSTQRVREYVCSKRKEGGK